MFARFLAVGLCTELKSSTEQLSKEFAALTAEKAQMQSSIESVHIHTPHAHRRLTGKQCVKIALPWYF